MGVGYIIYSLLFNNLNNITMREYTLKFYPLFLLFVVVVALYEIMELPLEEYNVLEITKINGWELFGFILCGLLIYLIIHFIIIKINNPKAKFRLLFTPESFGILGASNSKISIRLVRLSFTLPFILLSVLPLVISLITDNYFIYRFSLYMFLICLCDLYMLFLTRRVKGGNFAVNKSNGKGL